MTYTKITQVCAYANWPSESFEIWRLYPISKAYKEISKEMRSLFFWIFSHITNKDPEELERSSFTVGGTEEGMEVRSSEVNDITKRIYYGWYHGSCLDKNRLQYFKPKNIIKQGIVILTGKKQAQFYEIPKLNITKKDHEPNLKLLLRRILGDDPKRIEIDEIKIRVTGGYII